MFRADRGLLSFENIGELTALACRRFHEHEDKIVTTETEIGHGETEVYEGVQV